VNDSSPPTSANTHTQFTLAELAQRFQLECKAAPETIISGVAPLHRATPGQLSFLAQAKYRSALASTKASAVIMDASSAAEWPGPALIAANPYAEFARIAALFEYQNQYETGIHPSASVHPTARIGQHCQIAAGAVIGSHTQVGDHCIIGPNCVLEDHVHIGTYTRLVGSVTIAHHVNIGSHCLLHPGVVIGADGFGQAWRGERWQKVPQLGSVQIGDQVEIGANTTIDRGALDDTIIEDGVRIDNLVQIAHNVRIGAHTAIAACVGIAGSAVIGRYCLIGGAAAVLGHIELCDRVIVQGMSSITHSIDKPGEYGSAVAAQDARTWRRNLVRLRNLDKTLRELLRGK
jgi:UDP-3-O-[3-hydroxymyristoyl] glucosamine N-acyltransferase